MDKREFNIKVEQIKKRVNEGDYGTAMRIADAIDWRRVRNINLLTMVAQIYERNGEYGEAKNILLLAFERAPIGKRLLYKLTDLALKENNIDEAEDYYREFCDLAPEDTRQHLLRYMILRAKGAPAAQLIHSLEQYTSEELDEKWMYELAELYHETGRGDDCVRLCDKIMLMFGIGKYVDRAMELKLQYAPLTSYQMDLVENRDKYEAKLRAVEEAYDDVPPAPGYSQGQAYPPEEEGPAYDRRAYDSEEGPVIEEEQEQMYAPEENSVYQNGIEEAASQTAAAEAEYEAAKAAYQADPRGIYEEAPKLYDSRSEARETAPGPAGSPSQRVEPAPSIDQVLEAKMQEAREQERLAEEMARIAPEGAGEESEEDRLARTRVLRDIREVLPGSSVFNPQAVTPVAAAAEKPAVPEETAALEEATAPRETSALEESAATADFSVPEETAADFPVPDEESAPVIQKAAFDTAATENETEEIPAEDEPETAPTNHLLIEAADPAKGLEIAIAALKQIHRELGSRHPVAKISGEKLNKKGLMSVAAKLADKDLIVEGAGALSKTVLDELNEFMAQDCGDTIVVLIDGPGQIENLHRQNPELASRFEYIGDEHSMSEQELVDVEEALRRQTEKEAAIARKEAEEKARREREEAEERARREREERARKETEEKARREQEEAEKQARREAQELAHRDEVRKAALETIVNSAVAQGASIEEYTQAGWDEDDLPEAEEPDEEEMDPEYDAEEEEYQDFREAEDDEEEMDIDEFAQYACKYASDIDCSITGKSMLALYERIEIMEEEGIPLTRRHAEDLIEEAADKAEKPSLGKRLSHLFSSKYDKNGLLILKEEHFIE